MLWPHTKTPDVSNKHRKSKIANRKLFISAPDEFFDLPLPPSFKSLILAVQLPENYSLENQHPQIHYILFISNYLPSRQGKSLDLYMPGCDSRFWYHDKPQRPLVASFSQRSYSALRCSASSGREARRLAVSPMSVCRSKSCHSWLVL